jgi:hypothetical protein
MDEVGQQVEIKLGLQLQTMQKERGEAQGRVKI